MDWGRGGAVWGDAIDVCGWLCRSHELNLGDAMGACGWLSGSYEHARIGWVPGFRRFASPVDPPPPLQWADLSFVCSPSTHSRWVRPLFVRMLQPTFLTYFAGRLMTLLPGLSVVSAPLVATWCREGSEAGCGRCNWCPWQVKLLPRACEAGGWVPQIPENTSPHDSPPPRFILQWPNLSFVLRAQPRTHGGYNHCMLSMIWRPAPPPTHGGAAIDIDASGALEREPASAVHGYVVLSVCGRASRGMMGRGLGAKCTLCYKLHKFLYIPQKLA